MIYQTLFITSFTLMTYLLNSGSGSERPDLRGEENVHKYVISKFKELPNFYEELRSQNPQYKSETRDHRKTAICGKIFGFKAVIVPDDDEYDYKTRLQTHHQPIFKEVFKKEAMKGILSRMGVRPRSRYIYDDSSKSRSFLVNGIQREETTFTCVIENSDESFDLFYVSDYGYNLNEAPGREKLFGRFLFSGNQIYALAEELPQLHPYLLQSERLKTVYIEKRNGYEIAEKWENDPVCRLDPGRKFRLCVYLCANIVPGCEDGFAVQEPCTKMVFVLKTNLYYEWMLTCKMKSTPFGEEFFFARGYVDNEIFVFNINAERRLQLRFRLDRISVVIDKPNDKLQN